MLSKFTSWRYLSLLVMLGTALAFPPLRRSQFSRQSEPLDIAYLDEEDYEQFDPTDLSFITKMAAIGDSYSAGIGSGNRLGSGPIALEGSDWACSRYDHSYPYLVNHDGRLGDDPSQRTFEFKSCSGATVQDVLNKQIPHISGGQQVILLSAGGNDVGLADILNQCIYQWFALNKLQATVGKIAEVVENLLEEAVLGKIITSIDWDKLSLGCNGQLDETESLINSQAFSDRLDSLLGATKEKLAADGVIYYTGYGKFFNADTPECNQVTWTTWLRKSYNMFQEDEYLTMEKRQRLNDLVDAVNQKLREAIDRAGDNVQFIDYDHYIVEFQGRFCEAGVDEGHKESNTREKLLFYKLDLWDPLGGNPWKRSEQGSSNGTFEGNMQLLSYIADKFDPEASLRDQEFMEGGDALSIAQAVNNAVFSDSAADLGTMSIQWNILPDGYGRVFHPHAFLHQIIANLIIFHMTNRRLMALGYDGGPEVVTVTPTACSLTPTTLPEPRCESNDDCSSPSCAGGGVTYTCVDGFCLCAFPEPPEPTKPTTPELPGRPEEPEEGKVDLAYNLVGWWGGIRNCDELDGSHKFSISGETSFMGPEGDFLISCSNAIVAGTPGQPQGLQCVAGGLKDQNHYLCIYASHDCTGDFVQIARDDVSEQKVEWLSGEDGRPVDLWSYVLKQNGC